MSLPDRHEDRTRRQPADAQDLRRHPPQDETCLRVRGLLRDYADDELDATLRAAVELHVHDCRQCALALARAEHEVLRLERMAAAEPELQVPAAFAANTVQRLLRELGRESSHDLRLLQPTASAAAAASTTPAAPAPRGSRRHVRLLLAFASMAAAALVGAALLWHGYSEIERGPRLVAELARLAFDEYDKAIEADDEVREGAGVRTALGGYASFRLQPRQGGGASNLTAGGGTELQMRDGTPQLLRGNLEIETGQGLAIRLGDGSRVELGNGRYFIDATDYRAFDGGLDGARSNRQRVRVEVLKGEAMIQRNGQPAESIGAGQAATYQGFSPIDTEALASDSQLAMGLPNSHRVLPTPVTESPALVGQVFEGGFLGTSPAAGAQVFLLLSRNRERLVDLPMVDASGQFSVPASNAFTENWAVVQVVPPPGRNDLGYSFIDAVPVLRDFSTPRLSEPLLLAPSMAMPGTVCNIDGTPIHGVRILPCVVDELFGLLMPLHDTVVESDASGRFVLQRLPSRLGTGQQLAVLLLHDERAAELQPVPLPGSMAARSGQLQLILRPLRHVNLEVPAGYVGRQLEIVEELLGVPPGSAVRLHSIAASSSTVEFLAGGGRLWLRSVGPGGEQLRALAMFADPLHGSVLRAAEAGVPAVTELHSMQPVPGANAFMFAADFRQKLFGRAPKEPLQLRVADEESGRSEGRVQCYAVGTLPGGLSFVRFLGMFDGVTPLIAGLAPGAGLAPPETTVVAVTSDGRIASRVVDAAYTGLVELSLRRPGTVVISQRLRPLPGTADQVLHVTFTPDAGIGSGERLPFVRFAVAAEAWIVDRVPPGTYTVKVGSEQPLSLTVAPGRQAVLR